MHSLLIYSSSPHLFTAGFIFLHAFKESPANSQLIGFLRFLAKLLKQEPANWLLFNHKSIAEIKLGFKRQALSIMTGRGEVNAGIGDEFD
jgi:hypothetical protein